MKKRIAIKTFKIYNSVKSLPTEWNLIAQKNIFLSTSYLLVLEKSAPTNMQCNFIGIFKNEELVGISLTQFINLNLLESFGERDNYIKTSVRNFVFKNYCSHVLFIGNNMLTGQNAYAKSEGITAFEMIDTLKLAIEDLKNQFKKQKTKVHLTVFKDFDTKDSTELIPVLKGYYKFTTQPNMVFSIPKDWKTEQDYINTLSKKYRDQHKRARKKIVDFEKRKLSFEDIKKYENTINELYNHVAKNAPFNTFFLADNHFCEFKKTVNDNFLFYGYFLNDKMIGFNTLVKNGEAMDTYFLGYDNTIQREKMLYLNMLYDMIAYSIKKEFKEIVFARTALEIKSSVGAKPEEMFGFLKHSNPLIDKGISQLFCYLEPKTVWNQRNPFK
ncbi:MAG: hypothetical protein ACI9FW_001790 [Flavobacterium sp.]